MGNVVVHEAPHFEPFSPESPESSVDTAVKLRLACLQIKARQKWKVCKVDYDLRLQVCRLESEVKKVVKFDRHLEVEAIQIIGKYIRSTFTDLSLTKF